jgi:hypothetical protein
MTLTPFKGRSVTIGDRVRFHRNLHHSNWSVVALSGEHKGKVVAHADEVSVWGARFVVHEAGRQRVIREGRKNVHAYIEGTLSNYIPHQGLVRLREEVMYNPYRLSKFHVLPRQGTFARPQPLDRAGFAWGDKDGRAWSLVPHRV